MLDNFPLTKENLSLALFELLQASNKTIYLETAKWLYSLGANLNSKHMDIIFVKMCTIIDDTQEAK